VRLTSGNRRRPDAGFGSFADLDGGRCRSVALVIGGRALLRPLGVGLSLLRVEGVGRIFVMMHPRAGLANPWDFLATRPPPYRDSEYWSEAFLEEARYALEGDRREGVVRRLEGVDRLAYERAGSPGGAPRSECC